MPESTTKANRLGGFISLDLALKAEGIIPKCKPVKVDFWEHRIKDKRNFWSNLILKKARSVVIPCC